MEFCRTPAAGSLRARRIRRSRGGEIRRGPLAPRHFEPARASARGSTTVAGPMSDFTTLAPRVMLSRAWIWMESNGWYVVGALALWFAVIWPSVLAPALRAARSTAHAPSSAKVRDYEEGMRAARERQEAAAKRAQEAHAEHERERRARQAEELRELGLRRRGVDTGSGARVSTIAPRPPRPSRNLNPRETARMIRSGGSATAIPSPRTRPEGTNRPDGRSTRRMRTVGVLPNTEGRAVRRRLRGSSRRDTNRRDETYVVVSLVLARPRSPKVTPRS